MATAGDDGNSVKCPICLENYVEPRQMPTCAHSFCGECIIKYVSKLIQAEDGDLEKGIPCPFCRVRCVAPTNKDGLKNWVKSLKRKEDRIGLATESGDEKKCGENGECDSCRKFGISTKASKVCFSCFELFCVPCNVGRHSGKLYENHKVEDLEAVGLSGGTLNEQDLNEFRLLREYSYCSIHSDMEMKFYCKDDDTLCCGMCAVVSHRHCCNITELNIETSRNETKEEIQNLNASIVKLVSFAKNTIAAMKKCVMDSKVETEKIKETLHNLRRKINSLLDTLEESVGEQSKAIAKKTAILGENEEEALNTVISSLGVCSSILEKIIKYGSASQMHAVLTKVKESVKQHEMTVLDKFDAFEAVSPELKLENTLQIFLTLGPNDTDKLASVNEKSLEPCLPCYDGDTPLKNCNVVKNTEKSLKEPKAERSSPTYTDIVFLHNGNLVLIDNYNGYVCLANKEHEITAFCDIKTKAKEYSLAPYSCSSFRDGTIAVSAPEQRKIYTLSACGTLTINCNISTKYKPVAIHCLKTGDIAVSWKEPVAFGIISNDREAREKTYFCKDKSGRELKSFDFMAVDEDRKHVIQPCTKDKAVYCFDYEGFPKFTYTNSGLTYPSGVALDKQGNVYVCNTGLGASAVHVVTPSGKAVRIVTEGCSQCPLAIAFMKTGIEFAITQNFHDYRLVTFFRLQNP